MHHSTLSNITLHWLEYYCLIAQPEDNIMQRNVVVQVFIWLIFYTYKT